MKYPHEVSDTRFQITYKGRSTIHFQFNEVVWVTYIYGEQRGWKAKPLDYLVTDSGYRILPWEESRFWKWPRDPHIVLKIVYGRKSYKELMKNLVYSKNPFLSLVPKFDFG